MRSLQTKLGELIVREPIPTPETIAGVDVSFNQGEERMYAAIAVCDRRTLELIEVAYSVAKAPIPYEPGFLSFREIPALIQAWEALGQVPDVLMVDGHGEAHPRRLGIATHLGLWLDHPAIGSAKSRLTGKFKEPGGERGAYSELIVGGEVRGHVVRTRSKVQPVFVSVGHRVTLEQARELVLACSPRYRVPVPIRHAHEHANRLRRAGSVDALAGA